MVHRSSDGKILVVSILLLSSPPSDSFTYDNSNFLDNFWKYASWNLSILSDLLSARGGMSIGQLEPINPYKDFMPKSSAFFHYRGSLTTPPCTEGVSWLVYEDPVLMAREDLLFLRRIVASHPNTIVSMTGNDNRPPQPLHGRIVKKYTGRKRSRMFGVVSIAIMLAVLTLFSALVVLLRYWLRSTQTKLNSYEVLA